MDYSETPRAEIPDQFKWKIHHIFQSVSEWQAALATYEAEVSRIPEWSHGWLESPQSMSTALKTMDELGILAERLYAYASLQHDMDLENETYKTMLGKAEGAFIECATATAFMTTDVLDKEDLVLSFLQQEPRLAPYRFNLMETLRGRKHTLSTSEEQILDQIGLFSGTIDQVNETLVDLDIPRPTLTLENGHTVVVNSSNYYLYRESANTEDRRNAMLAYWGSQKQFANTFASLLNGKIKKHVFSKKVRGYGSCLEAALFSDNVDPKVYRGLITQIKANLDPLHRLMALRKKALGLSTLHYSDLYAHPFPNPDLKFPYDEAKALVLKATEPLGSFYTFHLDLAFKSGWVDIYPNKGKTSGAYAHGVYGVHPFVKMNYADTYEEVSTLAHEMGHAMHTLLSDTNQPYATKNYSLLTAEIASTVNETLLSHYMLETVNDQAKPYLLNGFLETIRTTLYRQTLFAEFELMMHEWVEEGNTLTPEWLDENYGKLLREYYGPDVLIEPFNMVEWSGIPHFYYNFYVYKYATGILSALWFAEKIVEGNWEVKNSYLQLLKAGGSDSPLVLLEEAGLNLCDPAVFGYIISKVGDLVTTLDRLVEER